MRMPTFHPPCLEAEPMDLRQATADDVPAMFEIRIAVRESHMTLEALAREGGTPASVTAYLEEQMRGWVVSCDDRIVGFSLAEGATGAADASSSSSEGRVGTAAAHSAGSPCHI